MIINNDFNVMGHLQPTSKCSQAEIDCWYNSNTRLHIATREDNFYQCKDIDDIDDCTQTNATDEYDTLLCKIRILKRILEN